MRISDLLESAGSIMTYLGLLGKDVMKFEQATNSVLAQYNTNPNLYIEAARIYINEINSQILSIVHDDELWNRFKSDSEIEEAYNRFVILHNTNDDFLESIR